jgi:hypothetical protein
MLSEREEEVMQTEEAAAGSGESPEVERGVTTTALALGRGEFGVGPGTIVLERVSLSAGTTSAAPGRAIEAGSLEAGQADYSVSAGTGYVWPGLSTGRNQNVQPVELGTGSSGSLASGDGYFFGLGATATITATSDAVILRAIVSDNDETTPEG